MGRIGVSGPFLVRTNEGRFDGTSIAQGGFLNVCLVSRSLPYLFIISKLPDY